MEYINGKVYYHIQSKAPWNKYPQWQQGATYTIGQSKNPWFGYFDENGKNIANPTTGKVFTADTVAALILAHQDGQPQDPELEAFFSYDTKNATNREFLTDIAFSVNMVEDVSGGIHEYLVV